MRFTVQQAALSALIQTVSKAVAVRTTKHVLTGILLEATSDRLVGTAYDLELGIQDTLPAGDDTGLQIMEPGAIVLPARTFAEVIRKLPGPNVSIEVHSNYMTDITSGSAQFHLHGIDAAEFPQLPIFHASRQLTLSSRTLETLIRTTAFAASSSEVRPVLTGVYVEYQDGRLVFTATDALRLATRSAVIPEAPEGEWRAILPAKALQEFAKILPDADVPVTLQFTDSHGLFAVGTTRFYTRMIQGSYPDTSRIIPTVFRTEVIMPTDALAGAIDRAALIARDRENHMVRLEVTANQVTVSSSSPEIGNVSEQVDVIGKTGDDLYISFNARYVLDALRATDTADLVVRFNGASSPFVICESGRDDGLQLISPVLMR
ncbi:MAG: DNA polymerase III subunit beta [Thermoflavifilum sp.]|nr:DNA polymerase III subunit beta [Thermoflavifilum sp.]MCL6513085.1 DNA polymerase III subunit beta [Alicyclobacillus sp.]